MSYCLPSLLSDYIPIPSEVVPSLTEGTLLNGQTETVNTSDRMELNGTIKQKNMLTEVFSFLICRHVFMFFLSLPREPKLKGLRNSGEYHYSECL